MAESTKIKNILGKNANKLFYFVRWYVDSDKSKKSFDSDIKGLCKVEYEFAMNEWLLKDEVQEAIKEYLYQQKVIKMLNIYNSMYEKALNKGDVNSAKWCMDFFNSEFFENSEDEIDNYLDGVNIPGLKKSGEK